jgi:uncharacterized protein YndB with AHSA1/START domain
VSVAEIDLRVGGRWRYVMVTDDGLWPSVVQQRTVPSLRWTDAVSRTPAAWQSERDGEDAVLPARFGTLVA